MSIRSFFKPKDGLPDPKGSLSCQMSNDSSRLSHSYSVSISSVVGLPLTQQHFSSSCLPYFFIYMVASNAANSFKLLHGIDSAT